MAILLGLAGKARSGKDSVGAVLCGQGFSRLAFADPVKDTAAALFGVPREYFDDPKKKEERLIHWGLSPRAMLQILGTDVVRRYFGDDFWIKRMRYELEGRLGFDNIVITDVRFENEAAFIRALGGIVVHIKRPGAGLTDDTWKHISEAGILLHAADLILSNDGTIEDLPSKVGEVLMMAHEGEPTWI